MIRRTIQSIENTMTRDRAHGIALMALALFTIVALWKITELVFFTWGTILPFGPDFPAFWAAARLTVEGMAALAFDVEQFAALQQSVAPSGEILLWHYPPTYPALIYPLGLLNASLALLLYSAFSLAIWVWAAFACTPNEPLEDRILILTGPAVYTCLAGGQNGTIVAALLVLFMIGLRKRRDWMVILSCCILLAKPHFGVLLPVTLIALGRWDLIWKSAVGGLAFILWSIWVTGPEYLFTFIENWRTVTSAVAERDLLIIQTSLFAMLVSLGAEPNIGFILQTFFALPLIAMTWVTFRSSAHEDVKFAFLFLATPLISPYAFQYDLVITLIGLWLLHRSTRKDAFDGQKLIIVLAWAMPLLNAFFYQTFKITALFIPMMLAVLITFLHVLKKYRYF